MEAITINDPRVPAGWRSAPDVLRQLRTGSHKLFCEDGKRIVLQSQRPSEPSYSYDPDYDKPKPKSKPPAQRSVELLHVAEPDPEQEWHFPPVASREVLAEQLRSCFPPTPGAGVPGMRCSPLNKWLPKGKPVLCGYATLWGVPAISTNGQSNIFRPGAFSRHLKSGVHAQLNHRDGDFDLGGDVALQEDAYGLQVFCIPSGPNALAASECIRHGNIGGMSLSWRQGRANVLRVRGQRHIEHLDVAALHEVTFSPNPANPHTVALAVNFFSTEFSSGTQSRRVSLLSALGVM